ncbi:MAG TPA: type II toxin-antitoxin system prevent-host-death family antitoxin [Mycobacteriales bacterium]|nr:type II toxin-antitoxin system prevent-host-death family antitoxin [Mycobacteriales bacterium]
MGEPVEVSVRDLRNHISDVLRRVESGERLRVTVDRRPVAQLIPLPTRRVALPFAEFSAWRARGGGADPELAVELASVLPDTTDTV